MGINLCIIYKLLHIDANLCLFGFFFFFCFALNRKQQDHILPISFTFYLGLFGYRLLLKTENTVLWDPILKLFFFLLKKILACPVQIHSLENAQNGFPKVTLRILTLIMTFWWNSQSHLCFDPLFLLQPKDKEKLQGLSKKLYREERSSSFFILLK